MKNESKTKIKKETEVFLEMSENEKTGYPDLIWDTMKVVLRGRVIDMCLHTKRNFIFVT